MDVVWYGIGDAFQFIFTLITPVGALINWFFGIAITIGVIYWLWYDAAVRKGKANYMGFKEPQ